MANRPAFICELDKDKLIDTQVGFVDTFNYAVRAIDNLEGGKNCTVDWTIDDHPVINVDIPDNAGNGDNGDGTANNFHFKFISNGQSSIISEGCVQIGGYSYFSQGGGIAQISGGTQYVCVVVDFSQNGAIGFRAFSSTSDINYAQGDHTKFIIPLYKISNYQVIVDYRPMPNAGTWEIEEGLY